MDNRKQPSKFVPKSYKRSDKWGITKIKEFLIEEGYTIKDKKIEDYGIDIEAEKDGKIFYFEIETKTGYPFNDVNDFKFNTVSFLGRKKNGLVKDFGML